MYSEDVVEEQAFFHIYIKYKSLGNIQTFTSGLTSIVSSNDPAVTLPGVKVRSWGNVLAFNVASLSSDDEMSAVLGSEGVFFSFLVIHVLAFFS